MDSSLARRIHNHLSGVRFWSLIHAAALKWRADNCLRLGASLSYYTIFSLFPLILITLQIIDVTFHNSDAGRDLILGALAQVTGGFRDQFLAALTAAQQARRASSIVGVATLLLGASWVFGELLSAFNIIWKLEAPSQGGPLEFLRATFFSFALVFAGVFLLLVSLIISAVLTVISHWLELLPGGATLWWFANSAFNLVALTLIFALLLRYLPQTNVAWHDVWLGAFITAVLWSLLQFGIAYYISFSRYSMYGPVGSIMALVVWVYLSSQVLFFGGEFTYVYARRYGSRAAVGGS
ncbi:MAG TPA: YihY/virulence factor BrkB family protein [Roseiflexaceae bacterium]|nr:YihY/virulence factor BrkB family protein [Roseiflexaceae bacterium]